MEHFYNSIGEDWFSYFEFYKDMVHTLPNPATVVEVGCWKGRSTAALAVEIINSKKKISLYCVDAWRYFHNTEQPLIDQAGFDEIYREFMLNMAPVKSVITTIRETSVNAADFFPNNFIDFVFLDAAHHYENVKADIQAWLPKVTPGGIISGHDYFTRVHPGVKQAVDEIFPDVETIPEQNVWYYKNK